MGRAARKSFLNAPTQFHLTRYLGTIHRQRSNRRLYRLRRCSLRRPPSLPLPRKLANIIGIGIPFRRLGFHC